MCVCVCVAQVRYLYGSPSCLVSFYLLCEVGTFVIIFLREKFMVDGILLLNIPYFTGNTLVGTKLC